MNRVVLITALTVFLSGCSYAEPKGDFRSIYCSVNIKSDNWILSGECIKRSTAEKPLNYLLLNDELFLRTQTTRSSALAVHIIYPIRWNAKELELLLKENPKLVEFFPDPTLPNKGVKWINGDR